MERKVFRKSFINTAGGSTDSISLSTVAVSYTHLDVYKRQVVDSTIVVKESELKDLYNKQKEQFKQYQETRDIKYIDVQVTASAAAVSYTHLDVYKRQGSIRRLRFRSPTCTKLPKHWDTTEWLLWWERMSNILVEICLLYTSRCV